MISKRIEYLLWVLATDNTQLAAYAGCSESNFSRLKSGARLPVKDSITIKKFANAVCQAARANRMTGTLTNLIKAAEDDDEHLAAAVIEWLFDENGESLPGSPWGINARQFGEKLSAAMMLAGLTNSKLSRLVNIDPSYISRMKNGSRMPKNNPSLVYRICGIIAAKSFEKGSEAELFELTSQQAGDEGALTAALFGWLYDKRSSEGTLAVGRLIDKIASIPEGSSLSSRIEPITVLYDNAEVYTGVAGLRNAAARLLGGAARRGGKQLLLFSDQPTSWLQGDYESIWTKLLRACVDKGTRIKIIHNINRPPAELFDAISKWLPFYMTGLVEPYYCTLNSGERQYSTVFIDVGTACVESTFVRGMEKEARYRYVTDEDELEYAKKNFELILLDCKPLIRVKQVDELDLFGKGYTTLHLEGIELRLGINDVIVYKQHDPRFSFCFEHPIMVKAFRWFIEEKNLY